MISKASPSQGPRCTLAAESSCKQPVIIEGPCGLRPLLTLALCVRGVSRQDSSPFSTDLSACPRCVSRPVLGLSEAQRCESAWSPALEQELKVSSRAVACPRLLLTLSAFQNIDEAGKYVSV